MVYVVLVTSKKFHVRLEDIISTWLDNKINCMLIFVQNTVESIVMLIKKNTATILLTSVLVETSINMKKAHRLPQGVSYLALNLK
jgi:hypothetical protein